MEQDQLRFWALRQIAYSLKTDPFDVDAIRARGKMFIDCVIRGHLTEGPLDGMEESFTFLHGVLLEDDQSNITHAKAQLKRMLLLGPERSGMLGCFIRAQLAHLERCVQCEFFVLETIRENLRLATEVKRLLADLPEIEVSQETHDRIMRKVFKAIENDGK